MGLLKALITAIAVGIGIEVLPGLFMLLLESGVWWMGVAGLILHTVALAISIWLVSGRWLCVSPRSRRLLALLALLQFPGALIFGAIFAIRRCQIRRAERRQNAGAV